MAKKKTESKASPTKKSGTSAQPGRPLIDTDLAANAAAAMVAGKVGLPQGNQPAQGQKKESAAFKQLKAGLNKPSAAALGGAFTSQNQQKKARQQFGGGQQIGHNQTFGADATRTGVPRRTPG